MSDADNGLEKKHQNLLQKYKTLRRNHRKLAGVALQLVEALEAFVKDDDKPDVRGVLMSCSAIYPGLVKAIGEEQPTESPVESVRDSVAEESQDVNKGESPEKEYFEGFWSKPKIPRTPLM